MRHGGLNEFLVCLIKPSNTENMLRTMPGTQGELNKYELLFVRREMMVAWIKGVTTGVVKCSCLK